MLIEVFKTGTHTDSNGNTRTWTEEDLDTIVRKYVPEEHEAPVVIGHPKDNAPAFGWVERLERNGNVLYAKLKDLVPEFVEAVKKGLYKKRSVSFYPDLTLRHIGFLGAMPPAVKGLADVKFSEADVTIEFIEYPDYRINIVGDIFRRLREWLIEKFDKDTADRIINDWEILKLQEIEDLYMNREKKEFMERDKLKEEIVRLKNELQEEKAKQRKTEFSIFCETLVDEGKVTPAMKPLVMDFMEILSCSGEFEFSEADGKVKAHPIEKFKEFLRSLPKQVEFGEVAIKEVVAEKTAQKKDIKDLSGWELIELYKNSPQEFIELVKKI